MSRCAVPPALNLNLARVAALRMADDIMTAEYMTMLYAKRSTERFCQLGILKYEYYLWYKYRAGRASGSDSGYPGCS
eukprot:SAG31_NODE_772_length_12197_cov_7.075963_8_plen_77_part_00